MKKPNNTKYAILGVLGLSEFSGYDVKKFLGDSIGHFWKISYSQVYPLLKELARDGLATVRIENHQDRPDSKIYRITDKGSAQLRAWLERPLDTKTADLPKEALLRLFFGGFVAPEVSIALIRDLQEWVARGSTIYGGIAQHLEQEHHADPHLPYWHFSLRFGQASANCIAEWCGQTMTVLQNLRDQSGANPPPGETG